MKDSSEAWSVIRVWSILPVLHNFHCSVPILPMKYLIEKDTRKARYAHWLAGQEDAIQGGCPWLAGL